MGLKKIFKSKKGIAIETAILSIIVIFSLCFLVTSLTLVGHYQVQIESAFILNDAKLDQIGEDFIADPENFSVNDYNDKNGFYCEVNAEKTQLIAWYSDKKTKKILEVEITKDDEGKTEKITKWQKIKQ